MDPGMATDIHAAITLPDTVETRLGALRLADGFPDDVRTRASRLA